MTSTNDLAPELSEVQNLDQRHELETSCVVAPARRGTTTDCDHPACRKGLSSRCRDQGGHPRRHHMATAGNVWTGQGRRSSEASFENGKSASEGMRTWLRHACMTLLVKRPTPLVQLPGFASNSRLFVLFPWSGSGRQEACSSVSRSATCENWACWFSLFCTNSRGESTACGFILSRCQNFNFLVSVLSHPILLEMWWSCQRIAWRWHLAIKRSWLSQPTSTDSMISRSHLCPKSSHGHQQFHISHRHSRWNKYIPKQ